MGRQGFRCLPQWRNSHTRSGIPVTDDYPDDWKELYGRGLKTNAWLTYKPVMKRDQHLDWRRR